MAYSYGGGGDYSTTSWGAQGGAGGGGFMEGTQPSGSQANTRTWGPDILRPFTILQILGAEAAVSDVFQIDGRDVVHASIIGQVMNVAKQATATYYSLDDGTGRIDARDFTRPDDDEDGPQLHKVDIETGQWVKCFGKMKQTGNAKRIFTITKIRPIEDKNEINYHLLECTAVHLYCTRGPPGSGDVNMKQEDNDGLFVTDNDPSRKLQGLSNNAKRVFLWLQKQPQSNEGYHAQTIATQTGIDYNDVISAGDELSNAALTWTTIDDQTWALLEQ